MITLTLTQRQFQGLDERINPHPSNRRTHRRAQNVFRGDERAGLGQVRRSDLRRVREPSSGGIPPARGQQAELPLSGRRILCGSLQQIGAGFARNGQGEQFVGHLSSGGHQVHFGLSTQVFGGRLTLY